MIVQWRKSSYSGGVSDKACVELGRLASGIGVRDSKDPGAGHIKVGRSALAAIFAEIRREDERST
ncbi:DUF397 domain-containing protein [Actinomadura sp. WMMB 499]|uniref:DUF397 domain-containing protein n=1 Tax=Actinomadura sp. WMMB 499 TaxID=1219491 RepID=UPI001245460B|nr:DUF397 domain-containing protein [Actinomadura sp. WMMB 499]QFG21490.1 DUF397 domain-containing protein [Actinomadura sp. WMMB 499]